MAILRWLLIKLVVVPGYLKSYRFVLKKLRCSTSAGETSASAHTFEMPRATSHGHLPGLVTNALPLYVLPNYLGVLRLKSQSTD